MTNTPVAHEHEGRRLTVRTDDGIALAVREFGSPDAATTVVFVHGHCLRTESWWALREQLVRFWRNDVRMVFYDHRGHGESGRRRPPPTRSISSAATSAPCSTPSHRTVRSSSSGTRWAG